MAIDAYYFPHDSNAKDDPKCIMLIEQLGLEGYGIFWVLIETLRDQPGHKYPLNLISALARRFNTTTEKMTVVIKNYSLFQIENDEFFFSESLNKRMCKVEEKREQAKKAITARWDKQKQLPKYGTSTDVLPENYGSNTIKGKEKKENKSKGKESNINIFVEDSNEFQLSKKLLDLIILNNPNFKLPNLQSWASDMNKIIRIDKRDTSQIHKVIEFCQKDHFWKSNILSVAKLRKQFDQLSTKMCKTNKNATSGLEEFLND